MKTAELEGALLDLWVARAQGNEARININETEVLLTEGHRGIGPQWYIFEPSTNWGTGGPIIEREMIKLEGRDRNGNPMGEWAAVAKPPRVVFGPTPLIAAMRAYVASKFGDEVPDDPA
jgi:hypothetical protein